MKWTKNIINRWNDGSVMREEWVSNGFTIDISYDTKQNQGYPGSNKVNVFMPKYGGWIMNTPKFFPTKEKTSIFVSYAKKQIENGKFGKRVPFPRD